MLFLLFFITFSSVFFLIHPLYLIILYKESLQQEFFEEYFLLLKYNKVAFVSLYKKKTRT